MQDNRNEHSGGLYHLNENLFINTFRNVYDVYGDDEAKSKIILLSIIDDKMARNALSG